MPRCCVSLACLDMLATQSPRIACHFPHRAFSPFSVPPGSRRWSSLAKWRLREFNELPHYVAHRLAASHAAARHYVAQFPSPAASHAARLVAFVAGSFAALLLLVSMVDEALLERPLFGRLLVWWLAALGIVLAAARHAAGRADALVTCALD